jgi:ADP-glucose pyrophosphorylase
VVLSGDHVYKMDYARCASIRGGRRRRSLEVRRGSDAPGVVAVDAGDTVTAQRSRATRLCPAR